MASQRPHEAGIGGPSCIKEEAGPLGSRVEHQLWGCPASWEGSLGLPAKAPDPASPQAQSWCLQHDLGHISIFRKSWWNHLAQQFVMGQLKVRAGWGLGSPGLSRGPRAGSGEVDPAWPHP